MQKRDGRVVLFGGLCVVSLAVQMAFTVVRGHYACELQSNVDEKTFADFNTRPSPAKWKPASVEKTIILRERSRQPMEFYKGTFL